VLGSTSTTAPLAMERFDGLGVKIGDSKRRKNKFLAEHPWCCFCGGSEKATTEDHQPARSLFDGRRWPEGYRCGVHYLEPVEKPQRPDAPAVKREAEEDWGKGRWR
jgi:hypothetical protein